MLFIISKIIQHAYFFKASSFLAFLLSFSALAVQPMSESDLEVVSATTGSNILNIFGASQAGLKIDDSGFDNSGTSNTDSSSITLNTEKFNEGEETKPAALNELRSIEEENLRVPNNTTELILSNKTQSTILKINEKTTGNASVFKTTSEVNYQSNNVNHQMRNIENGGIGVSRDLQIDLLKLENLSGDHSTSRSVGSIYLSDWRSLGDTRILTTK